MDIYVKRFEGQVDMLFQIGRRRGQMCMRVFVYDAYGSAFLKRKLVECGVDRPIGQSLQLNKLMVPIHMFREHYFNVKNITFCRLELVHQV